MTKYHINKHGIPSICRAKEGNCPLGGDESHFDNKADAQKFADIKNEEKYQLMPSISEDTESNEKLTLKQLESKLKKKKEKTG